MKYIITGGERRGEFSAISEQEHAIRVRHHQQALENLLRDRVIDGRRGLIFASVGLAMADGSGVTVKNRAGKVLSVDGPFPETKEVIGGFDVIDFDSADEAQRFAQRKNIHKGHVAEVRPVKEMWWIAHLLGASESIFALMIVEDEGAVMRRAEAESKLLRKQHQSVAAEYVAQRQMRDQKPGLWVGIRLSPSSEATTLRCDGNGFKATDGPFAETKEVIGGFYLIGCDSMDDAVGWARKLATCDGDALEVRAANGLWWVFHE